MAVNRRWAVLILFGFFLSACTSTSVDESRRKASAAVEDDLPTLPEGWDADAVNADVLEGWISSFNDRALESLVAEAQAHNRDLAAAAAGVESAQALARQAGAALVPNVGMSAGASRSGAGDSSRPDRTAMNVGMQISWEADVWGRVRAGADAAGLSAEAVLADYRFAQQSIAAATAKAYFAAIEAKLQTETAQSEVATLQETLRLVDIRYNGGLASAADQSLARSDLAAARERLIQVEGSTRDATRALEVLLGRYPGADLETRDSLPVLPPPPPAGMPSEVLERRPDLVAAESRVAASFSKVDQAVAARLPSVSLNGSVGGASSSLSDLLDPSNIAWQVGTSLLATVFDGGALEESVVIANAEQQQAVAAYAQTALTAFREVETALDQGQLLEQRKAELDEVVSEAENAYRINSLLYGEGEISLIDLLGTQRRVNGARANLVSIERLQLEQRVNLHLALGGEF